MIRIAICDDDDDDDDVNFTESIVRYLEDATKQMAEIDFSFSVFHSGEDFLSDVRSGRFFHVVFMDIQMGGISGTEAGEALRATPNGDEVFLVFISNHDSHFEEIAYVGSFRFIRKPVTAEKFNDVFHRACNIVSKNIENESKQFHYNINIEMHSISVKEIA